MSYAINLTWAQADSPQGASVNTVDHRIAFSGGLTTTMTSAPDYGGNPRFVNPEEAMAAALSSCHFMTFLALCTKAGWKLSGYRDRAVATLGKMENGRMRVDSITLHPVTAFASGQDRPRAEVVEMHERAHRYCFVANALNCEMNVVVAEEGSAA